jgi:NDP-sugar pyrophosphorylase family protein
MTITEHIISKFVEYGCSDFSLIVNHQRNLIKAYFADQQIPYALSFYDEDEPLGTGGGLKLLEGRMSGTFFMTNCDIIINENYENILKHHKKQNNIITLVSATKNVKIPYGTLELNENGSVVKIKEKPSFSFLTNTGLYVIEPRFLDYIPDNEFVPITDTIEKCIKHGENVGTYPISEDQWLDMGQLTEMENMRKQLGVD